MFLSKSDFSKLFQSLYDSRSHVTGQSGSWMATLKTIKEPCVSLISLILFFLMPLQPPTNSSSVSVSHPECVSSQSHIVMDLPSLMFMIAVFLVVQSGITILWDGFISNKRQSYKHLPASSSATTLPRAFILTATTCAPVSKK